MKTAALRSMLLAGIVFSAFSTLAESPAAGAGKTGKADSTGKSDPSKSAAVSTRYSFRNEVFVDSRDVSAWKMVEGKEGQDTVVSFILSEGNKEKALVGISRMDDIFTNPERMKVVAEDEKRILARVDKKNKASSEMVKLKIKGATLDAVKITFTRKVDGKDTTIYLFCVPSGKNRWRAYGMMVSLADSSSSADVEKLIRSLTVHAESKAASPVSKKKMPVAKPDPQAAKPEKAAAAKK